MTDKSTLVSCTRLLQRQGQRRLAIFSGDDRWCEQQAMRWMAALAGDWLWLGDINVPPGTPCCHSETARTLLGREFLHAVFDARHGFSADAFAALSGTLKSGSWLVMLAPPWTCWASQPDHDSLRWSEQSVAIATPNFSSHLMRLIEADSDLVLLRQGMPLRWPVLACQRDWQPQLMTQQRLIARLLASKQGIYALIAPRGRGKSALAGQLAASWPGRCLITAPAKISTTVLARFAGEAFTFIAPDRLLASSKQHCEGIDWLIIDEAAAIPTPLLEKLITRFPRVLLTTTLQGFEGTGRGFLLKFCTALPEVTLLTLDQPLRWAMNDPLERFVNKALLFDEPPSAQSHAPLHYVFPHQTSWQTHPQMLSATYQLLTSAHYRTSPLDLRRMMDAPGMHFSVAMQADSVQGALWLVDEGGLSPSLAQAVWVGLRRPRGNLVAQSLAAHAGFPEAAQLHSRRISRIAITPHLRRRGVGREMVSQMVMQAQELDFLSVSFGYTPALWAFWRACGFHLVRIGTRLEASSGCYTAMAMLPLSKQGRALCMQATQRLARDWPWLARFISLDGLHFSAQMHNTPDETDWQQLAGFAWGQRPFEAVTGALGRLLSVIPQKLPLLHGAVIEGVDSVTLCQRVGLHGRKALLAQWRLETQQALMQLDAVRSESWRVRIIACVHSCRMPETPE